VRLPPTIRPDRQENLWLDPDGFLKFVAPSCGRVCVEFLAAKCYIERQRIGRRRSVPL
jgi:hypothetical protein